MGDDIKKTCLRISMLYATRGKNLTKKQLSGLYKECYDMAQQIGDTRTQIITTEELGDINGQLKQFAEAVKYLETRQKIAEQNGDSGNETYYYYASQLGNYYYSLGQYDRAIHHNKICLNHARQTGDKAREGPICGNLGNCYDSLGQYGSAIYYHEVNNNIAKQMGDRSEEARANCHLGITYRCMGEYHKAIRYHKRSLEMAKQIHHKESEVKNYSNLGICYDCLGDHNEAIRYHEMRLNTAQETRDREGVARAYGNLGASYRALKDYTTAIFVTNMALSFSLDKVEKGIAHGNLGTCYYSLNDYDKAIHHFEMHVNIAKEVGDKAGEGRAYANLGACYHHLNQYGMAEIRLRDSVRCFEELFENAPKQDHCRISVRDTFFNAYCLLTSALLFQNKTDEALVIAERGRARALAELMLTRFRTECTEVTEARVLDLNDVCDVVKTMKVPVLFLSSDTEDLCMWVVQPNGGIECRTINITDSSDLPEDPALFVNEKLQSLDCGALRKLDDGSSIHSCEDRSLSFLYPEEGDDQPAFQTEEMNQRKVVLQTDASAQRCPNRERVSKRNPLNELYKVVLGLVRQFVKGSNLVVVAYDVLNFIPFAALMDDNQHYLAESLQIRLIPSLATAKMIMQRPQEPGFQGLPLIIGDPETIFSKKLPGAYKEAQMIGQLLGVPPLTGKDATKKNFLRRANKANLIHIAAHGDRKRGEILLASEPGIDKKNAKKEDFMLMLADIEAKCLNAKLVVLSCCHSAHGKVTSDGVIGIARSFIGAGARAVLVALWAIDDEATLYFMKSFYQHLSRGKTANESLDKAMRAMRDNKKFCDFRCWAPFVLIGDNVSLF